MPQNVEWSSFPHFIHGMLTSVAFFFFGLGAWGLGFEVLVSGCVFLLIFWVGGSGILFTLEHTKWLSDP